MDQSPVETPDERIVPAVGNDGAPNARGKVGLQVTRVDGFTAAGAMPQAEQELLTRRFSTLLVDSGRVSGGGVGRVEYAEDVFGAPVAIKTVDDETARDALLHEYEVLRALSGVRGFPHVYGFGRMNEQDVMLMEWIEGPTLAEALPKLADSSGVVPPLLVAHIGCDLFALIERMGMLDQPVVHRDIAPQNIMVDTSEHPLEEQVAAGRFELKLVDFGSAIFAGCADENARDKWEGATIEFAAPEMLAGSADAANICESPAADVYASASVLRFLLMGANAHMCAGKQNSPGQTLVNALAPCLSCDPAQRPSSAEMERRLTELAIVLDTNDAKSDANANMSLLSGTPATLVLLTGLVATILAAAWLFRKH